ncbi:MAG: hypothetical protein EPN21_01815 [Methylococcaceae bacterium]|nr:MAG: hypothetical protein EPN21_01815 [Methylococcaceae bacterium]
MPAATLISQRRKRWPWHRSLILLASLAGMLYFGGEMLPHLLEQGTHLLLESLEMLIEEFYEHVLHLPRREAEIVTVWSGAIMGLSLLYWVIRIIVRRIVLAYLAVLQWWRNTVDAMIAWKNAWSEADVAILAAVGVVVVIMLIALLL